jgi:hypothetical protein
MDGEDAAMKCPSDDSSDDMLPEYHFSGGILGKCASLFASDTITFVLDTDEEDDKEAG